jgi:hypothetical protein
MGELMKKYLIIFVIFCFVGVAYAKEKLKIDGVTYEISVNRAIKDKLRVKFYKKSGETYLAKKIKLKNDETGFEVVNA